MIFSTLCVSRLPDSQQHDIIKTLSFRNFQKFSKKKDDKMSGGSEWLIGAVSARDSGFGFIDGDVFFTQNICPGVLMPPLDARDQVSRLTC